MSRPILWPFLRFSEEGSIIGRLLAGYTTLEVGLMNCVQVVRDDFDAVLKAMFRARSETSRIDIADALGRHFYHDRGLGTEFEMGVGAVRHCLKIRKTRSIVVNYAIPACFTLLRNARAANGLWGLNIVFEDAHHHAINRSH
jgi:hypothetical protein